jgi:hypothetical protein
MINQMLITVLIAVLSLLAQHYFPWQMLLRRKSQQQPYPGDSSLRCSRPLCALPYYSGMRDAGAIGGAWDGMPRQSRLFRIASCG